MKVRVPPEKPPPVVESKIKGGKEHRFSRKPRGAIQLAWEGSQIAHIHDKVCGNNWKIKEGKPYDDRFELRKREDGALLITCKKCGQISSQPMLTQYSQGAPSLGLESY